MSLENRVAGLERVVESITGELVGLTGDRFKLLAEIYALRSYVVRLAESAGLPPSRVLSEIEELRRQELDTLLRKAEDTDPDLAANIDDRRLEDLPDEQED